MMKQAQRIKAEIGKDQFLKVELQQDFSLLEVLSLRLTQQDIYTSICSDYGVVCGRVVINSGYGVPNARVSIFIPQQQIHEDDPVISNLYPYKAIGQRNEEGFRYNLLPVNKQHSGHASTGTFPDQLDVLNREEVLEVFETYYKYTVKTNESGDFMIWGVPLGEQQVHVDLDLSDMGCFSLRPDDFLNKGYGIDQFKSSYEFKNSSDIDSLPQIVTFDQSIDVYPFWGNQDLCEIGLTRVDFDLSDLGIKIEPAALLIGGSFSDDGKSAINKNCTPKRDMGKKCSLTARSGIIEAIRFTSSYDEKHRPILEEYIIDEGILDDGSFAVKLPMNMNFLYTNEYGENDYTNDPNKGIPTTACYRLRLTLNDEGVGRVRGSASYLVPNIREYEDDIENKSYAWSLNLDDYHDSAIPLILYNEDGDYIPKDYFYKFQYGKVYTVSSFQSLYFKSPRRILAINDLLPSEDKDCSSSVVTPPVNMGIRNTAFNFQLLLALVITFMQYIYAIVSLTVYEWLSTLLWDVGKIIYKLSKKAGNSLMHTSVKIQEAGQMTLPLTIYDTCDECTTDDEALSEGASENYCKIAEYEITVSGFTSGDLSGKTQFKIVSINEDTNDGSSAYDSGPARHCTNLNECCDSYKPTISGFSAMNSEIYEPISGIFYPRFLMFIGGNIDSPLNSVDFLITGTSVNFDQYPIEQTGTFTGFTFNDEQIAGLFGIETGHTYFESNPINFGLYGYTLDRQNPLTGLTPTEMTMEEECQMYDTLYNESNINSYLWVSGASGYSASTPVTDLYPPAVNEDYFKETLVKPGDGWTIAASVFGCGYRLPSHHDWKNYGYREYERKTKTGYSEFRDGVFTIVPSRDGRCANNYVAIREWYRRKVIGLYFCGGIVNYTFADNWLSGSLYFFLFKSKIKDKKNGDKVKACEKVVRYVPTHERFYYRSAFYKEGIGLWGFDNGDGNEVYLGHPTTFVDLGPRDEFIKEICTDETLDPNCSVSRSIGPTSFKSFGELVAFAVNYKMDVRGADMEIYDFFKNGGFYENNFISKVRKKGYWILNGDIIQLISVNSEAGIDGFDMQNQKYMGYSISVLDPDNHPEVFKNGNQEWGPTPIVLKYEDDGVRIRQCLNAPGNLTESAQVVPFYLWDKKGQGFGLYNPDKVDDQMWDYSNAGIAEMKLQGMAYNYKYSGGTTDKDDPYLLPPMSYSADTHYNIGQPYIDSQTEEFNQVLYPVGDQSSDATKLSEYGNQHHGFTILFATKLDDPPNDNIMNPVEGRLYIRLGAGGHWEGPLTWIATGSTNTLSSIWATRDPYGYDPTNNKQILSTPFMFYFGLRPGRTGIDKLVERFGPKGAFPPIE